MISDLPMNGSNQAGKIVIQAMQQLAIERPVFYSEDDFKLALGMQLSRFKSIEGIRMEKCEGITFYDRQKRAYFKEVYIDLGFYHANSFWPIELKYKTKLSQYEVGHELYALKDHSARDLSRFNFRKDIYRVEQFVNQLDCPGGFCIFLTNEEKFWEDEVDQQNMDGNYRLNPEITKQDLGWIYDPAYFAKHYKIGEDGKYRGPHSEKIHWTQRGENHLDLSLRKTYRTHWRPYSFKNEGESKPEFKFLLVEVSKA